MRKDWAPNPQRRGKCRHGVIVGGEAKSRFKRRSSWADGAAPAQLSDISLVAGEEGPPRSATMLDPNIRVAHMVADAAQRWQQCLHGRCGGSWPARASPRRHAYSRWSPLGCVTESLPKDLP